VLLGQVQDRHLVRDRGRGVGGRLVDGAAPVLGLEGGHDPAPLGVLVEVGARRCRLDGPPRVVVGVPVDQLTGLLAPAAVHEQPVGRRAGQGHLAGVRADVGRGLEVGRDAGVLQHVEQVLADPGIDVAQRAPEDGVQPVVASTPAHEVSGSAAGTRARIHSAEPLKIRGASLSRVATW
jgi:hypothetical protein